MVIRQRIRRPWRVRKGGPFGPQQRKPNKLDAAYTVCRDATGEASNFATLPGRRWQPTRTSVLRFARTVNPCSARRPGLADHPGAAGVSASTFTKIATVRPNGRNLRVQASTDRRRRNTVSNSAATSVNRDTAPTVNGAVIIAVSAHASGCTPAMTTPKDSGNGDERDPERQQPHATQSNPYCPTVTVHLASGPQGECRNSQRGNSLAVARYQIRHGDGRGFGQLRLPAGSPCRFIQQCLGSSHRLRMAGFRPHDAENGFVNFRGNASHGDIVLQNHRSPGLSRRTKPWRRFEQAAPRCRSPFGPATTGRFDLHLTLQD